MPPSHGTRLRLPMWVHSTQRAPPSQWPGQAWRSSGGSAAGPTPRTHRSGNSRSTASPTPSNWTAARSSSPPSSTRGSSSVERSCSHRRGGLRNPDRRSLSYGRIERSFPSPEGEDSHAGAANWPGTENRMR